jgi:hypothetical protein
MKKILSLILLINFISTSFALSYEQAPIGDYDNQNPGTDSCTILNNNMRLRSTDSNTGGEVSKLQAFLQEKNYLNSEPTGYFGSATQAAVKNYQIAKNLAGTGFVGNLTRAAIRSDSCISIGTPPILPAPTSTNPYGCPENSGNIIVRDGRSENINVCVMLGRETAYCNTLNGTLTSRSDGAIFCDTNTRSNNTGLVCTLEQRLCSDGSAMQRYPNSCEWNVNSCPRTSNSNPVTENPSTSWIKPWSWGGVGGEAALPMCDMTGNVRCSSTQRCLYQNNSVGYGCPANNNSNNINYTPTRNNTLAPWIIR